MTKISIQPNASGSGTFTLTAPDSNDNRTFTLPDATGEVVLNEGSGTFKIDSAGNVGIGTSSPDARLQVNTGSTDSQATGTVIIQKPNFTAGSQTHVAFEIKNATQGNGLSAGLFTDAIGNFGSFIDAPSVALGLSLRTGGTERMRIDSAGTVLVGKSANDLSVDGIAVVPQGDIRVTNSFSNDVGENIVLNRQVGTGRFILFRRTNVNVGSISTNGTSTSYNTSSDYRLKENVTLLSDATDRLMQIPVHRFNFIADPDTTVDGFLAHEVQPYVPEAISGTKDEVDDEGNPVYQGIDQSKLVPLLTAALQEALADIAMLKAEVAALKGDSA